MKNKYVLSILILSSLALFILALGLLIKTNNNSLNRSSDITEEIIFDTETQKAIETTTETTTETTETTTETTTQPQTTKKPTTTEAPTTTQAETYAQYATFSESQVYSSEVLTIVNQYRDEVGATSLILNNDLCMAAYVRANEMAATGVFSHTRPNGTDCFTVFTELGISYVYAGENIAMGYYNAASVCQGWYDSTGHYENMVSTNFGKMGIACVENESGYKYWAQIFSN